MKICQYLKPELIIADLKAQSKEGVLAELAQQIAGHFPGMKAEEVLQVLLERERLGSTGIGEGFAIPHGKMKNIDRMIICLWPVTPGDPLRFHGWERRLLFFCFDRPGRFRRPSLKGPGQDFSFFKK